VKQSKKPEEAGGKLGYFDPEDGSDKFLNNVGVPPKYTALQPRRQCVLHSNRREILKPNMNCWSSRTGF
jgi:hypothetical protein